MFNNHHGGEEPEEEVAVLLRVDRDEAGIAQRDVGLVLQPRKGLGNLSQQPSIQNVAALNIRS